MKKKSKSIKRLKKEADAVFSKFIRIRDKGQCFTCPTKGRIEDMQCGHYVSRSRLTTRYDEENCHCQCVACNVFKNGNMVAYSVNLMKLHGKDIIEELHLRSQVLRKFSRKDYEGLIAYYKNQINLLTSL